VNLTLRQRELLKEFQRISERDLGRHNPRSKSRYERVNEFFEGEGAAPRPAQASVAGAVAASTSSAAKSGAGLPTW